MINRIISTLFLTFLVTSSAVLFAVAVGIWLFTFFFDRRLVLLHYFTSFWACLYIWIMPGWSLATRGRLNIRPKTTYVVVSNHQSQLDILVAFRLFFPFKWVSKTEVFRLPFIGWNMVLNRYIPLVRGDRQSIKKMLSKCEKTIAAGNSIFMFPEGTRSYTGQLKPFKPGAFLLAHKMRVPILPVVITGTREALPKYSLNFHGKHPITIEVLPEIAVQDFETLSVEDTSEMIRQLISAKIGGTADELSGVKN